MRYLVKHWRGELPLAQSAFVNGLLGYLAVVGVLVWFGNLFRFEQTAAFACLALFAAWYLWALVGISRCIWRTLAGGSACASHKALAIAIGVVLIASLVLTARDVVWLLGGTG